jgi:hypothetical protein
MQGRDALATSLLTPAQLGDLLDEDFGLGSGKVRNTRIVRLQPPAVSAGQIASDRRLPK